MRIALLHLDLGNGPLGKNLLLLEQAASTAAAHGAQWVVTPETALQGYFFYQNDTYVLLHQFRKKSQKTPKREIEKAKAERNDYLRRKETAKL